MKALSLSALPSVATRVVAAPSLAPAAAYAAGVTYASDLREDAEAARQRAVPILVMFSARGCPYCELVMADYIEPMSRGSSYADKVIIRVVDVDGYRKLVDFSGSKGTHSEFAARHGATLTPVIKFFGPDGRELAEQIVGFTNEHFYGYYLEARIDESLAKLRPVAATTPN